MEKTTGKFYSGLLALALTVVFIAFFAVQARAEYWSHMYGSPEGEAFQDSLDAATGTTRISGNEVVLLPEATRDFQLRQQIMDNAVNHIHVYTLCISNNETGLATVSKMIAKATLDGVETNLIYHPISQIGWGSPTIILAMKTMGVNVRDYWVRNAGINAFKILVYGCHKKVLLADSPEYGLEAIVGGRNIGDEYLANIPDPQPGQFANQWRDTDILVRGPITKALERDYINCFNEQSLYGKKKLDAGETKYFPETKKEDPNASIDIRLLENEPDRNNGKGVFQINTFYKEIINKARYSIDVETPYFVPPVELVDALIKAMQRGVKVRFLVNSENTNDMGAPIILASGYYWEVLMKAGAEIYLWDIPRSKAAPELFRTLHSKVLVVDSCVFAPGSWNFDNRASYQENEYVFAITDVAKAMEGQIMYNNDIATEGVYRIDLDWINKRFGTREHLLMQLLKPLHIFL